MKFLLRYWYFIVLAFLLSFLSAAGGLYLERDKWMAPGEGADPAGHEGELPGMSEDYVRWNYEISGVEDLRVKLEAEREDLQKERQSLEVYRTQVEAEVEELKALRAEIEGLRDSLDAEFIEISDSEEKNIKRLSKVYAEMKSDAAVAIFAGLDIDLVVKILSQMQEERASRILAAMGAGKPDSPEAQRAAQITELIQKVR